MLRNNYQLVYFYRNPNISAHLIEKYYVEKAFYYDFISKPDETKWQKEIVPYKYFDLSESQIKNLIKQYQ